MSVCPAKTQISLGICPVWSESFLSAWRKLGSLAIHRAHSEDSDQTGRIPRLIWVFPGRTATELVLSCRGLIFNGYEVYRKTSKNLDTKKFNYTKIWLIWSNASKQCRRNGKQYRRSSDCSSWSSLIWVYTVCSVLSVRKFRNIAVDWKFCHEGNYSTSPGLPSEAKQISQGWNFHFAPNNHHGFFFRRESLDNYCHMHTTKALISLRICTVWSAPLLFVAYPS